MQSEYEGQISEKIKGKQILKEKERMKEHALMIMSKCFLLQFEKVSNL